MRVWNDRLQGLSSQASVLIHCSSLQPTQALSLVGWPCPGRPGWWGSVFGTMQTLWCAGGGVGATQLSSSLQRQEEDGHEPPELRVGLAGGSTAGHHHHCDGRERGDRPGLWSAGRGQGAARSQAGCDRTRYSGPLSGGLKVVGAAINAHSTLSTDVRWCGVGANSACQGPNPGSVAH